MSENDLNTIKRYTKLKAEFEKQTKEEANLNASIKENLSKIILNDDMKPD